MLTRKDLLFLIFVLLLFLPFFLSASCYRAYETITRDYPLSTSFIKFAILATLGEMIGLRIRTGKYYTRTFGVLPRAVIWGILGITIFMSFVIFHAGTRALMIRLGFNAEGDTFMHQLAVAFCTSVTMNIVYAPVMMTMHKITDSHIWRYRGSAVCLVRPVDFLSILETLDWKMQWEFIFKRTIPFFWIPAHTVTFMLPSQFRVLFAAVLGIVLGVFLAFANMKRQNAGNQPAPGQTVS